jgi:hypothetical protein
LQSGPAVDFVSSPMHLGNNVMRTQTFYVRALFICSGFCIPVLSAICAIASSSIQSNKDLSLLTLTRCDLGSRRGWQRNLQWTGIGHRSKESPQRPM